MVKPKDFDTARGLEEREPLPAGGYVCRIVQLQVAASRSGNGMIKVGLDIAEGPQAGRFSAQFREDTRPGRRWPCIAYQLVYDPRGVQTTNPGFKTFITSVEESNEGFEVKWGDGFEACFSGLLVGVLFQREQYPGNDGRLHWCCRPVRFRGVPAIREGRYTVPADKPYSALPVMGGVIPEYGGAVPAGGFPL